MFQPGDVIDERYDIIGLLGHGGMSHVFRARDRHLQREVALKVLRPHLTDADSERFRREIRTLARLDHPAIVSIFDLGLGEAVYFAMELIRGGPVTDLGPYEADTESQRRLLGAAASVADAIGYVHRLGIVHRDITPRNILLTEHGQPKVMDFGLVQLTETTRQLTRTGFTLGTPQYMAPEQARGDPTDAATDLYAFGAVLYRTVTGVAPFEAENDQAILYQHVYGSLTPPVELNPQIPDALSRLIIALLSKDPGQRPASAYAVADALRVILATELQRRTSLAYGGPAHCSVFPTGPADAAALERSWQVQLDEGPQWPAGISAAEGFVLIGLRSDAVAVLRPADGGVEATFDVDDEVTSTPLYAHDRLYFISRDGALHAISWPQGTPLWRDEKAGAVGLVPYGRHLLATTTAGLELLECDGGRRWGYATESPAATSPLLHRQQAAFYTVDGWLHSVDATTGKGRYKVEIGTVGPAPSAAGGILLLPTRDGEVHAFDMAKREVLWSYDLEGALWTTPTIWQERVYLASWSQTLHCLSLRSGDDLWATPLPSAVTATPVVAGGTLYVATEGGELLAFDARSGRPLWQETVVASPIQASPLPLGDRLIIAALDGTVSAFRT